LTDFTSLLATGTTAFVASNIDDTFVLILLFLTPNLLPRNIIIGQFLGIALLVAISSFAALLVLAIPPFAIGLMGFIPIAIGIKRLLDLRGTDNAKKEHYINKGYVSFLSVAAVTVSNGGDDIGVFTPIFAKYSTVEEVTFLVTLFMVMTGIWCIVTYCFISHPFIISRIKYISHIVTPFGLIGIGVYIISDSFIF